MTIAGDPPAVSVVMAAYNGIDLIGETLGTLAAQTFTDFEVLVVDDCSTDTTRDLIRHWPDSRVRLIAMEANGGPVLARNRGVGEARGRYIAALDQDDLCRPDRFARQVAYLDAHPDCVLLGTQVDFLEDGVIGASNYAVATTPTLIAWLTWIENPIAWSSVMLRTDAARRLDPFTRHEILYAEDFDLYHRMQAIGGIARLDEALLVYRRHAGGVSHRYTTKMESSAARVLTDAHAAILGDDAATLARLLVLHVMRGKPVPDRATLATLATGIATLQRAFLASHDVDAAGIALIRAETARRWAGVVRIGVRAGTLTLADVAAVPADREVLGGRPDDLLWLRVIGRARTLLRRSS